MIDLIMNILRAFAATGVAMVLSKHIDMSWWEPGVISFAIMIFFGNNNSNRETVLWSLK